jgi:hypothetical protein
MQRTKTLIIYNEHKEAYGIERSDVYLLNNGIPYVSVLLEHLNSYIALEVYD